jgi:hypothetical protein
VKQLLPLELSVVRERHPPALGSASKETLLLLLPDSFNSHGSSSCDGPVTASRFRLVARVSTDSPERIRPLLGEVFPEGQIREQGTEFEIETSMEGSSAKDLNRRILSALRAVEKRTRLRAEWTAEDDQVYRFFDYVLKSTGKK